MTLAQARKHYEYTLARFDEADREDRGWRRVAMERAKEELDRLTVEPPPNPSDDLVRLQFLASVMLEVLKEIHDTTFDAKVRDKASRTIRLVESKPKNIPY